MTLNEHPRDGIRTFEDEYAQVAQDMGIDPSSVKVFGLGIPVETAPPIAKRPSGQQRHGAREPVEVVNRLGEPQPMAKEVQVGLWVLASHRPCAEHIGLPVHLVNDEYAQVAQDMGIDPSSGATVGFDPASPRFMDAYLRMHDRIAADGGDFWWITDATHMAADIMAPPSIPDVRCGRREAGLEVEGFPRHHRIAGGMEWISGGSIGSRGR